MKRITAFLLFVSVLALYIAPTIAASDAPECYVSDTRYYDSSPSQFLSTLSPEEEEALLGTITAKYESNGNPGAISSGNGDAGGVSFGAYQFASRAGVPLTFANWCVSSGKGTDIGNRLINAYNADGNTYGTNFKAEWSAIAAENADGFLALQHDFVKVTYYDAIVTRVENNVSGFDIDTYGIALKNVFWSRAVQHGVSGAYNVISRAFTALGGFDYQSEETLIRAIYAESGALSETGTNQISGSTAESLGIDGLYMKYYSANSSAVQVSVYRRLHINELTDVLNMLRTYGGYVSADAPDFELADTRVRKVTQSSAQICGFLYNYGGGYVSDYGIIAGRSADKLESISLGGGTSSVVLSVVGTFDGLTQDRAYVAGVYAVVDGQYRQSELVSFATGEVVYYTVTFLNYDGTVLAKVDVPCGDSAVYDGETPAKPSDTYLSYTFSSWSADLSCVTQDMTVFPLFTAAQRLYTVTFLDYDGTVLDTATVPYGASAAYGGHITPSRPGNSLYRKVFSTWDKDLSSILDDTVCKPVFCDVSYLWSGDAAKSFSGGDGSMQSPYLICCAEELALFASLVNGGRTDICARLTENIVLNHPSLLGGDELPKTALVLSPIGSAEAPFSGSFDGGGFKIVGLVTSGESSGLFGIIDGGEVKDLIIDGVYSAGVSHAGGLAGQIRGGAAISQVAVYGDVISDGYSGMLCGSAEGGVMIEDIYCAGSVTGKTAGSVGGSFDSASLSRVFAQCTVQGDVSGGVGGKWQAMLAFSHCFYEVRDGLSDIIAVPVASSALQAEDSYRGLTSNDRWVLTEGGARLALDEKNSFNYDVFGDFNLDGVCNAVDAVLLAQLLANWDISGTDHNKNFDPSGDGITNVTDSVILAQAIAGWSVS